MSYTSGGGGGPITNDDDGNGGHGDKQPQPLLRANVENLDERREGGMEAVMDDDTNVDADAAAELGNDDDPSLTDEERFLKSTAELPKSIYGRMKQLTNVPGFPHSPPQVLSAQHPKAYLYRNFLTSEECDHLIALAKEQLAPSTVVGTGGPVSSSIRTSAGMFLFKGQTPMVRAIEERIASASGLPEPNGEGMQILRYEDGQKYEPHYDYFHDKTNSAPRRGGQRMATMLIYLQDTEAAGGRRVSIQSTQCLFSEDSVYSVNSAYVRARRKA